MIHVRSSGSITLFAIIPVICKAKLPKPTVRIVPTDDFEFLLTRMRYKERADFFGMAVDEEAKLSEDREPNVLGENSQVVVVTVGADGGVDEAIDRGVDWFFSGKFV
jgi:hypothetical protein